MLRSKVMVLTLWLTGNALAQPAQPIEPKKVKVKDIVQPVKIEKQQQVRPAPADLVGLAARVAGKWRCTGTGSRATSTIKLELGKQWLVETFDAQIGGKKHQHVAYTTYDAKTDTWQRVTFDSAGVMLAGISSDMSGDGVTWNMSDPRTGAQVRDQVEMSDPKRVTLSRSTSPDQGKSWSKLFELTCKK